MPNKKSESKSKKGAKQAESFQPVQLSTRRQVPGLHHRVRDQRGRNHLDPALRVQLSGCGG